MKKLTDNHQRLVFYFWNQTSALPFLKNVIQNLHE